MQPVPYVRLSGFYFFYFASIGAIVPFWSLYLDDLGLSAQMIGTLLACMHVTRILAPSLWGWLADVTGQRIRVIRYGALATWLVFGAIFWQQQALGIGLVMLAYSLFWNAILPQFEVVTLQHLGDQRSRYSQIRLWGSVGFIVAVLALGWLFERLSVSWLPWIVWALLFAIWLNSLLVDAPAQVARPSGGEPIWRRFMVPQVLVFFLVTFLSQLGHGPYYAFYSIQMEQLGYDRLQIGLLWSLGVVAEVLIFMLMHRLMVRFSLRQLMLAALALSALRWVIMIDWADQLGLMIFAQMLHAATFGVMHAVGIALIQGYFPERQQGQGQALFSALGFGAGGALGVFVAGALWQHFGAQGSFGFAALVSTIALLLAWVWIRPERLQ